MIEVMARIKTTHAKHDPAHCLAPKMFRSLKKGKRQNNLVTYQNGKEQIRFACFEALGVEEMKILQAVVALSGPDGLILDPQPNTSLGTQLRLFMDCKYDAIAAKTLMVKESMRTLLNELGLTGGDENIKAVLRGLERMGRVTIDVEGPQGKIGGFSLLSYAWENPQGKRWDKGRMAISVNPMLTQALLADGKYVYIDMHEVRTLRGDAAALIHQRLCAWVDPGKTGKVETDTLIAYVYGEVAEKSTAAAMQRKRVRVALGEELAGLPGWKVKEYARDKWAVARPPVPKEIEVDLA